MCDDNSLESEDDYTEENNSESDRDETNVQTYVQTNVQTYVQTYNLDILDSIAICRETYFFNLEDQGLESDNQDEFNVLKYIYEQIANIYTDESLIRILTHIRYYYETTFPENVEDFELFYISVYPQALMIDRRSSGIVRINTRTRQEIPGSFINFQMGPSNTLMNDFINNLINPSDISFNSHTINLNENSFPTQSNRPHLSSPNDIRSSSLLNEIMFLSSIFNMRSNDSLLHVLNLMNNVLERADGLNQGQTHTASQQQIKELESQTYESVQTNTKEKNSEYCTICQDDYNSDSLVKILPCEHFFHSECIEPWLLNCSALCPICRKNTQSK